RPGANTHAERREADSATDQRIFEGQRGNQLYGREQGGGVRLGAGRTGGPGIRQPEQEEAGIDPSLCREGNGAERAAGNATHPAVSRDRDGRVTDRAAAAVSEEIHGPGHHAFGRGGPGARMAERAGNAMYSAAGVRTVRQAAVRAAGGDLQRASVQSAPKPGLSQGGGKVRAHASEPGVNRRATSAGSAESSRVPAGGHGAPGRS